MKYPESRDVDWRDFGDRAKAVLLQFGSGGYYFLQYEDDFIKITYDRHHYRANMGHLEVTRKKMPGHEKEHLRNASNPLYMESDFERIRVHGEGRYIYQHLIDLTTPKEGRSS